MSDLPKRIRAYCRGKTAMIAWPHRILHEAAEAIEVSEKDTRLDTCMKLLRDNKNGLHIGREMNQTDHDVLRESKTWGQNEE